MARTIDAHLRQALEQRYGLCVEVAPRTAECRGWISITPVSDGDSIRSYYVREFDFYDRWLAMEYDPCGDEYPYRVVREFHTEAELNHFLDKTLPADAELLRGSDVDDFPG
ncbi:MAG: hypothetical protein RIT81_45005 [Deltaproteobacteria bacterium]